MCLEFVKPDNSFATTAKIGKIRCRNNHALFRRTFQRVEYRRHVTLLHVFDDFAGEDGVPPSINRSRKLLKPYATIITARDTEGNIGLECVQPVHEGGSGETGFPKVASDESAPASISATDVEYRLAMISGTTTGSRKVAEELIV